MTSYLIVTRVAIILWVNMAVMPAALTFNAIEAELKRRGIELWRQLVEVMADGRSGSPRNAASKSSEIAASVSIRD